MKIKNILISSIGSPAGHGVVKCLQSMANLNIIGLDANQNCHSKNEVDKFYLVPKVSDLNYLSCINDVIRKESCDLFIPTIQPDLNMISEIRKLTQVLSSRSKSIENSSNKRKMYEMIIKEGLEEYVPKYFVFNSNDGLNSNELNNLGYPNKSVSIKPATEHGGVAFKMLNLGTISDVVKNVFENKNPSWKTEEELSRLLENCKPIDLLASEYLPGDEYSVDALVINGDVRIAIPRKRTRISGGIVVQGIVEKNNELIEATKKIIPIFDLDYFINIQFKYTNDGIPKLIDINPRFCGSHIMSFGAGINFPLLAIKAAFNEEINVGEPVWGTEMVRYWESVFYEANE